MKGKMYAHMQGGRRVILTWNSCSLCCDWCDWMGAMYMLAWLGYMAPPGLRNLSRATRTESSMDSRSRKYPIHSEMMMSTFSGSSMLSIVPWMTSMTFSSWKSAVRRVSQGQRLLFRCLQTGGAEGHSRRNTRGQVGHISNRGDNV